MLYLWWDQAYCRYITLVLMKYIYPDVHGFKSIRTKLQSKSKHSAIFAPRRNHFHCDLYLVA